MHVLQVSFLEVLLVLPVSSLGQPVVFVFSQHYRTSKRRKYVIIMAHRKARTLMNWNLVKIWHTRPYDFLLVHFRLLDDNKSKH